MGARDWQNLAVGRAEMNGAAVLSLIATIGVGVVFLLMLQESIALSRGQDPLSNGVRLVLRRFPRSTYAFAVVIGMVLGHLVWP